MSSSLPTAARWRSTNTARPAAPSCCSCTAAPGRASLDPDPDATAAAGVRLLTVDRPGYGASLPYAADVVPTFANSADDLDAVLADLGVDDVGVIGWSNGGVHALVLAARHPDRVRAVALVGTPASDDDVPWVPEEQRALGKVMREDPRAACALAESVIAPATADVENGVGMLAGRCGRRSAGQGPACARPRHGHARGRVRARRERRCLRHRRRPRRAVELRSRG